MGYYEEQQQRNLKLWQDRAERKAHAYQDASQVLAAFGKVVVHGVTPGMEYENWIKSNPELALRYADTLLKIGQYWDGERLYGAVDTVADKMP